MFLQQFGNVYSRQNTVKFLDFEKKYISFHYRENSTIKAQSSHLMSVLYIYLRKYIRVRSKVGDARFEVENISYNFLSFIWKSSL